jgi:hypothetical protein
MFLLVSSIFWRGAVIILLSRAFFSSFAVDCHDRLYNQTYVSDVVAFASLFDAFSFDMLQSLVYEMNLYDESPDEAVQWLNIHLTKAETRFDLYEIQQLVVAGGIDVTRYTKRPLWYGNPAASESIDIHVYQRRPWWQGGGYQEWSVSFSPQLHLQSGNVTSGTYVLVDDVRQSKVVLDQLPDPSTGAATAKLLEQ